MTVETGKTLEELAYEVGVLHRSAITIFEDEACICWQEHKGTFSFFNPEDGYPQNYWLEDEDSEDPYDDYRNIEVYRDFNRFLAHLRKHETYYADLLNAPVWKVQELPEEVKAFNTLLGDVEISL